MFCFPTQQTFWKGCPRLLSPLLHYPSTPSSIKFSSIISQNLLCQSCQWDHWPCKHSQGALVCLNSPWHSGPLSLPPLPCDHSYRLFCSLHRHSSCYGSFPWSCLLRWMDLLFLSSPFPPLSFPFGLSFFCCSFLWYMFLALVGRTGVPSADGWSRLFIPRIKLEFSGLLPPPSTPSLEDLIHSVAFKTCLLMIPKFIDLSSNLQPHMYNCLLVNCIS